LVDATLAWSLLAGVSKPKVSRALIEAQGYLVEVGLWIAGQVGFFKEVLSQQPVRVFVGAALPRALRITEVDFSIDLPELREEPKAERLCDSLSSVLKRKY
jgi:hypothetical protein